MHVRHDWTAQPAHPSQPACMSINNTTLKPVICLTSCEHTSRQKAPVQMHVVSRCECKSDNHGLLNHLAANWCEKTATPDLRRAGTE